MNTIVDKKERKAIIHFDLADDNDRGVFIHWLKNLVPTRPEDQFAIDNAIMAAGGEVEPSFPGYENMKQ